MLPFYCVAILNFLLRVYSRYPNSAMGEGALKMTLFTLKAMANGGMHDHVGQVRMYVHTYVTLCMNCSKQSS